MNSIVILAVVLLLTMLLAGGVSGLKAFISLGGCCCIVFLTVILIAWYFPYLWVTTINAVIILVLIIYLRDTDLNSANTAFCSSVIILTLLILLIIPLEHWAQVQGFSSENSADLESMSLLIGFNFMDAAIAMTILSCLGAIAEAAVSVAAVLSELLRHNPTISNTRLAQDGMLLGKQIIATAFNTLFFGFFGGFLALFIWFIRLNYTFGEFLNNKIFVVEFLMTIISIIGVILAIPLVIWITILGRAKSTTH
ncbi:YibE/F family protein [Liquorilactobacillus capillatus]|uniref:Integral membrane protein n=1 Tax=Liquorilactobacillus capillatus DSM 19910 TaxID=1423731 RepID=A0A0R1M6P7_9LACO|nr:YibE/F family protein [Liquorilactobacillus capillatus]KRL00490.1 hypothetical protein FC81_GL002019 [Liquorilactobacillus capillatus DSM 19910]